MKKICELLSMNGPMFSSQLFDELENSGIERNTARQLLHRTFKQNLVQRKSVTFGKGQYLYFLPQEKKNRIRRKVLEGIKQRKRLNRLFEALKTRKIIPLWHAAKISGVYSEVPTERKADSLDKLLNDLEKLELGKVINFTYKSRIYRCLVFAKEIETLGDKSQSILGEIYKKLGEEETIINEFISTLESSGLGKEFEVRPASISVPVDALGNSKKYLLAGEPVSSKILVDVNALWKLDDYDIEGLLDRVHAVRRELEAHSVIVYIVADLKKSALKWANSIGWKSIRPSRLKKIEHIENLRHRGILLLKKGSSREYRNVIREIRDLDDLKKLGNYRAEWFENLARDLFDELGYHTRRRKRYYLTDDNKLTERRTKRIAIEVDVFGQKSNDLKDMVFCECKNWLERVPVAKVKGFVRSLDKLHDYYMEKEEQTNMHMQAFFITSEIDEKFENGSKIELTIVYADDFQEFARRRLAQK